MNIIRKLTKFYAQKGVIYMKRVLIEQMSDNSLLSSINNKY